MKSSRSEKNLWMVSLSWVLIVLLAFPASLVPQSVPAVPVLLPGQTATRLADGRLLLIGGEGLRGASDAASIWDPRTNTTVPLQTTLSNGRSWHTATTLPDGLVLILGGLGRNKQVVEVAEIYNPADQTFSRLPITGVTPRARHTATLLSDGQVLIVGGVGEKGESVQNAEVWNAMDSAPGAVIGPNPQRRNHTATLLPDGRVLIWGGSDTAGRPLASGEIFDSATQRFTAVQDFPASLFPQSGDSPSLVASIPLDRSVDVDVESIISVRFSKPLRAETVNAQTVSLAGPKGLEKITVVPAENGLLAFVTPESTLLPGATYTVTINGAVDRDGLLLPLSGLTFSTKPESVSGSSSANSGAGLKAAPPPQEKTESGDDDLRWKGKLKDGKPHSDWQDLPPLRAPDGVTALAGQVLDLRGRPLAHVKLKIKPRYGQSSISTETDSTGRFLLSNIQLGRRELIIDGRIARWRPSEHSDALGPEQNHGVFEYGYQIQEKQTNVLPFTIWLPKIDTAHAVSIPHSITTEIAVKSPKMPGLEVRLAPNTTITDHEGKPVTEVSLTEIPLDRTPFPLPRNVHVPIYFTAQPGGAYIHNPSGIGARIYYPNSFDHLPGTKFEFWHYDPSYEGWYKYGLGTVPPEGKQIVPDPGISVHEFTGAMVGIPALAAALAAAFCNVLPFFCSGGDPVNLATGLFVLNKTDLYLPDGTMPLALTRTYRQSDTYSRAFGIGTSFSYDLFLVGDTFPYTFVDLIFPDGARLHYERVSPGTSFGNAVYENNATQTRFFKSRLSWNGAGWDLKLRDGTVLVFRDGFGASRPGQSGLIAIQDRNGNVTSITRDASGDATKIATPSGRWLSLTYNTSHRVTQAQDSAGRTVTYEYDTTGRLIKVTDPNGGITEYTYDTSSRMLTIKDARGIVFITNEYDTTGKVIKQTMVDGGEYLFDYTMNGSTITETEITDPRGNVRRVTFNSAGQVLSHTNAPGTAAEQITTFNVQTGTNFVLSEVDPLNRTTSHTYDSLGNMTSRTRLAGTGDAVTTTFTYDPVYSQLTSVTDPLNHTTTFGYDLQGNLTSVKNALNQTTTITRNASGQPVSVTDPLNNATQFSYELGDLVAVTDPLGNTTSRIVDSAGRVRNVSSPLNRPSVYDYDVLNRLTKVTDPQNGVTDFTYDPNGNLLSVTDARSNATIYTYNNMDQLATRKDPLLRTESYQYDLAGNLTQFTDRKSQAASYTYDAINRRTGVTYADASTTSYTYDKGNRLTQVVDSIAGTITRTFDGLDRLTSETTPQGSVSYTYDAAGRRATMTVAGQPTVNYTYDNANRLTLITQGSSVVAYTYDAAGRRTSLTLPNGVLVEYGYDNASRLTSITYKQNGTTLLGDLAYAYDKDGNRTETGGSFARTGIPQAVSTTAYNAANHQTTFGDKTLTYDNNGNLQTITDAGGTTTYTWNARNQLTGISGPGVSASFVYDGLGRREKKTINSNLTEFLYDGLNPVQETSGAAILANILPGLGIDEFLTRTDVVASVTSTFLTDALGSPVALTDNAGGVQVENTYEPFGKKTFSGASNSSSYEYTGRENDGTGLYYYRARYYHPALQRFLGEDPIEFAGGDFNLYSYVGNNPLIFVDSLGFEKENSGNPPLAAAAVGGKGERNWQRNPFEGDDEHIKKAKEIQRTNGNRAAKEYLDDIVKKNANNFSKERLATLRGVAKLLGKAALGFAVLSELFLPDTFAIGPGETTR